MFGHEGVRFIMVVRGYGAMLRGQRAIVVIAINCFFNKPVIEICCNCLSATETEYDILRVWACLGLLTAAEQYLGWVLWHLPFYGAAKCVMLGVAITLPEARVAPILFDRAVVPSMERLDKYLGYPLINSLFKHLWDVPIFFLELFIYPTDRAEDDIKWSDCFR